jgi:hypothetical protein
VSFKKVNCPVDHILQSCMARKAPKWISLSNKTPSNAWRKRTPECSCDQTNTARAPIPTEATAAPFSSTHSSSSQSSWIVFTSGISSLVLRCIPPNWCQIGAFYADCGYRKLSRWEVSRPKIDLLASDAKTDDIVEVVVSIISNKRRWRNNCLG